MITYKQVLNRGLVKEAAPRWVKVFNSLINKNKFTEAKALISRLPQAVVNKRLVHPISWKRIEPQDYVFGAKPFNSFYKQLKSGTPVFMSGSPTVAENYSKEGRGLVYALQKAGLRDKGRPLLFTPHVGHFERDFRQMLLRGPGSLQDLRKDIQKEWKRLWRAKTGSDKSAYAQAKKNLFDLYKQLKLEKKDYIPNFQTIIDGTSDRKALSQIYRVDHRPNGYYVTRAYPKSKFQRAFDQFIFNT